MTDKIASHEYRLTFELYKNSVDLLAEVRKGKRDVPMSYLTEAKKFIASIERELSSGKNK